MAPRTESVHFAIIPVIAIVAAENPLSITRLLPNFELNADNGARLPLKLNFVINSVTTAIITSSEPL